MSIIIIIMNSAMCLCLIKEYTDNETGSVVHLLQPQNEREGERWCWRESGGKGGEIESRRGRAWKRGWGERWRESERKRDDGKERESPATQTEAKKQADTLQNCINPQQNIH